MNSDLWWLWIILVFILIAFLIWLFGRRKSPADTSMAHPVREESVELEEPAAPAASGPGLAAAVEETPAVEFESRLPAPLPVDDLEIVEGIGPKIAGVLKDSGITTFAALAAADVSTLDDILVKAGLRRLANPATWPRQAALAAEGRMDELKAYQDTLKAGRAD